MEKYDFCEVVFDLLSDYNIETKEELDNKANEMRKIIDDTLRLQKRYMEAGIR